MVYLKRNLETSQINYLANRILNSDWSTVRISSRTPGNQFYVKGIIQSGLSIVGQNYFSSPLEGNMDIENLPGIDQLRAISNLVGNKSAKSAMTGKSLISTLKSYTGSSIPSFMVNFVLVNLQENDNCVDDVTKLHAAVLPRKAATYTYLNPLEYSGINDATDFSNASNDKIALLENNKTLPLGGPGTLHVAFSKYFYGFGLVCRDINYQFSDEHTANGPLYATVSMTFEPKRMITIDEFRNYFSRVLPDVDFTAKRDSTGNMIKQIPQNQAEFDRINAPLDSAFKTISGAASSSLNAFESVFDSGINFVNNVFNTTKISSNGG